MVEPDDNGLVEREVLVCTVEVDVKVGSWLKEVVPELTVVPLVKLLLEEFMANVVPWMAVLVSEVRIVVLVLDVVIDSEGFTVDVDVIGVEGGRIEELVAIPETLLDNDWVLSCEETLALVVELLDVELVDELGSSIVARTELLIIVPEADIVELVVNWKPLVSCELPLILKLSIELNVSEKIGLAL